MNFSDQLTRGRMLAIRIAGLLITTCIASCVAPAGNLKRPQISECPVGMVLICEGQNAPSRGGDEEIPGYDRCYCESAL